MKNNLNDHLDLSGPWNESKRTLKEEEEAEKREEKEVQKEDEKGKEEESSKQRRLEGEIANFSRRGPQKPGVEDAESKTAASCPCHSA